ncbi:MAG: class I SAM-dependent methyltransferase [Chloracidobacterium sp.]|nr:class I SAM-dependent methyltransferase [Chloracidobacterium sp.]
MASFAQRDAAARNVLVDAVGDRPVRRVLDVGCGAGQDLLPFLDETMALCVGIDVASGLGQIEGGEPLSQRRARFVRATGERMPFANDSFDVVICRVALPYMDNKKTIAEVGRILKPGGVFLLKTHRFRFYLEMIWSRSKTLNPKLIAYPLICLAAGLWHELTGRQLQRGFWHGKEIFQTRRFLEREFRRQGLSIKKLLPDSNSLAQSQFVEKSLNA